MTLVYKLLDSVDKSVSHFVKKSVFRSSGKLISDFIYGEVVQSVLEPVESLIQFSLEIEIYNKLKSYDFSR